MKNFPNSSFDETSKNFKTEVKNFEDKTKSLYDFVALVRFLTKNYNSAMDYKISNQMFFNAMTDAFIYNKEHFDFSEIEVLIEVLRDNLIYDKIVFKQERFWYEPTKEFLIKKLGYKIIQKDNNKKDIPDIWIEKDGEAIPVEVKVRDFNGKALKQLERYLKVYNCKKGIAIAKNLTVELPENIFFISLKEIEKEYRNI